MASALGQERRVEVVLPGREGSERTLYVSPGMERFIGRYALIPEFAVDGALIKIRAVG